MPAVILKVCYPAPEKYKPILVLADNIDLIPIRYSVL
jgi:hypothetical protein